MNLPSDDESSQTPALFAPRRRLWLKGRGGLAASITSTLLILATIVGVLFFTSGGGTVRYTFLNPHYLWLALTGDRHNAVPSVVHGFVTNVWLFMISEVLVLFFGLVIAWIRVTTSPLLLPFRILAAVYSDVLRSIPFLLWAYLVMFGLPQLQLGAISNQQPVIYGCLALTTTYSAYVSEVYRAGLNSVPQGQILAARSLGLTNYATMRRVILPQAVRTVIPPLLNDFISLQKDTAIVSVAGVVEIARSAQIGVDTYFNESALTMAAILFIVITIPLTRVTDRLIAKDRHRRLANLS